MNKWLQTSYPYVLAPTVQDKHQFYSRWAILQEHKAIYSTGGLSSRTFFFVSDIFGPLPASRERAAEPQRVESLPHAGRKYINLTENEGFYTE